LLTVGAEKLDPDGAQAIKQPDRFELIAVEGMTRMNDAVFISAIRTIGCSFYGGNRRVGSYN